MVQAEGMDIFNRSTYGAFAALLIVQPLLDLLSIAPPGMRGNLARPPRLRAPIGYLCVGPTRSACAAT